MELKLDGKKTYVIGVLIMFVVVAHGMQWLDQNEFFTLLGLLNAGGIMSIRHGIDKMNDKGGTDA